MTKISVGRGPQNLQAMSWKKLLLLGKTKYKTNNFFLFFFPLSIVKEMAGDLEPVNFVFSILMLPNFIVWPWASHLILLSRRILLWKLRFSWMTSMRTFLDKTLCSLFYGLAVDASLDLLFYNDIFAGVDTFQNPQIILWPDSNLFWLYWLP